MVEAGAILILRLLSTPMHDMIARGKNLAAVIVESAHHPSVEEVSIRIQGGDVVDNQMVGDDTNRVPLIPEPEQVFVMTYQLV
jgi:hypothetical protein